MNQTATSPQRLGANHQAIVEIRDLKAWFGASQILKGINVPFAEQCLTAIIGPSGCGKSTLIRCLNRLHEEVPGARIEGDVLINGQNIYASGVDPVVIRRKVGMVFQRPNPFPGMSIADNVLVGPKLHGVRQKAVLDEVLEVNLRKVALWNEVKDKLNHLGTSLSGGQQQRLCMARALAINPPIILMDEPTSALDPIASSKIEELMMELKKEVTVITVTHNMHQAARISDYTCFMVLGELIEFGESADIFTNPRVELTQKYISGKFG